MLPFDFTKFKIKETLSLLSWAKWKIPLIYFVSPRIVELSEQRTKIVIPLLRRNKNHLGSMYFGVLATGADLSGAIVAFKMMRDYSGEKFSLVFKQFDAKFLKRAEADVLFICNQGNLVRQTIEKARISGERINEAVQVIAYCPKKFGHEPIANFTLTISIKRQG